MVESVKASLDQKLTEGVKPPVCCVQGRYRRPPPVGRLGGLFHRLEAEPKGNEAQVVMIKATV